MTGCAWPEKYEVSNPILCLDCVVNRGHIHIEIEVYSHSFSLLILMNVLFKNVDWKYRFNLI